MALSLIVPSRRISGSPRVTLGRVEPEQFIAVERGRKNSTRFCFMPPAAALD